MASSYYSPGKEEQDKALQGMLIHAKNMKEQGRNFWGKELKVDPSKGKGAAAQTTVTNAKRMPVGGAMGRGLAHQNLAKDLTKPAINAAKEVGAVAPISKFGADHAFLAKQQATNVATKSAALDSAKTLKVGAEGASTGLKSAASSAMPYLLAAQLGLSILGAKGDDPGKLAGGSGKHKEEELLPGLVG